MRTIVLFFFLLTFSIQATAQEYRPLSSFQGDTLSFFRYNFIENKDRYVGSSFEKLITDIGLPLIGSGLDETSPFIDPEGKTYLTGVTLFFPPVQWNEDEKPIYMMPITLDLPDRIDYEPLRRELERYHWDDSDERPFFLTYLKNYIITRIRVVNIQ